MVDFFNELTENIQKHNKIILMTHGTPDLDGLGSAIAFSEFLRLMNKECYIVAPKNLINKGLNKAINFLQMNGVTIPFKHENSIDGTEDLLIIFDVNQNNFVESPLLLERIKDKIIIDHHSKGLNQVSDTICEYVDDEKSSTVEILGEYLKYLDIQLDSGFYTVLLAGLCIDSDDFNFKTTAETFQMASYLVQKGADLRKKQEFLKEPIDVVFERYNYIKNSILIEENICLSVVNDRVCSSITVAKLADEMLKFENVDVSFALGIGKNGEIFVSARSLGDVDVSKLMVKLGGGGRPSSAAARIYDGSVNDVIESIKTIVKEDEECVSYCLRMSKNKARKTTL